MARPATTRITSPYGNSPGYDGFHNGIDFAHIDPSDTPVFAFRAGIVTHVGWVSGWAGRGFVVIVDHGGGVVSWSCHLASASVSVGQSVSEGQRIATMGRTGTTAVHLHWMVYLNGTVVNPTPYLTSSSGGTSPFVPGRTNSMTTLFHREGSNVYALAGDSPGTPANWLETSDGQFANKLAETHGNAKTLSPGTWDNWKAAYLAPVKTTGGTVNVENISVEPDPEVVKRLTAIEAAIKAPRTTSVG